MTDTPRSATPPSVEELLIEAFLDKLLHTDPEILIWIRSLLQEREARSVPQSEPLDVERLAEWLHRNAATRRVISCGPESTGCRQKHRLDARDLIEYARLRDEEPSERVSILDSDPAMLEGNEGWFEELSDD